MAMYLIKTKRSPYYQVLYRTHSGKLSTKSTGTKLKSEALKFLVDFKHNIKSIPDKDPITLKKFCDEFLNNIKNRISEKYYKSLQVTFDKFDLFIGEQIPLQQVDIRLAESFINSVFQNSKYVAANHYRNLRAAFNLAMKWNYISQNPFTKFKAPKLPKLIPVFINYAELLLIIEKTKTKLMQDIFFTAFFTGLRLNELSNLTLDMIDLESNIITLKHSETFKTKGNSERIIPINNSLHNILKNRIQNSNTKSRSKYVFSVGKSIPINGDWISQCFRNAVRAAGLNDAIHFHTLRHSFASNLIQNGVSLYVVKELLGHKDFATTQIYSHVDSKNLSDAVKRMDPKISKTVYPIKKETENSILKYDICLN